MLGMVMFPGVQAPAIAGAPTPSAAEIAEKSVTVRLFKADDQALFRNDGGLFAAINDFPTGWTATQESGVIVNSTDHTMRKTERYTLMYNEPEVAITIIAICFEEQCHVNNYFETPTKSYPASWLITFVTPKGQHYVKMSYVGGDQAETRWLVYIDN